jgi:transportin-3
VTSIGTKLSQDDQIQVYEAIAHVISAMPMQQAAESLKTFAQGLLAQVHAVVVKSEAATREELREVCSSSMQSFMEEIVN